MAAHVNGNSYHYAVESIAHGGYYNVQVEQNRSLGGVRGDL